MIGVKIENMTEIDRLVFLIEEIDVQKSRIEEHGAGHIHTTIRVLKDRVEEIRRTLNNEA